MNKAFASAAVVVSTPVAAPVRHLSRPAPVIAPARRRRPTTEDQEYDPADDYSQDDVEVLASEMAQEVAGADLFSMDVENDYEPLKLGSLTNVREAATKRAAESKTTPKRKARK